MKIRDVLEADWNVNEIDITVRETNGQYLMGYNVGHPNMRGLCYEFLWEHDDCAMYRIQTNCKKLFIKRTIQAKEIPPKVNKLSGHGVLLEQIPKQLLDLEISHMRPTCTGFSSELHGYDFTCNVDAWSGIKEEYPQETLEWGD